MNPQGALPLVLGLRLGFGLGLGLACLYPCVLSADAAGLKDVWLLGTTPFTGGIWDAGESVRVAGDMMTRVINEDGVLLPGYRLGILWQDDWCSSTRLSTLLMNNLLGNKYYLYPPLPHTDQDGDGRISTEETADHETELLDADRQPVGLIAAGCSQAAMSVVRWTYRFGMPMISSTNTDPKLSTRKAFPNYFRVIAHEGAIPSVMLAFVKMLGISRASTAVGEESSAVLALLVKAAAQSKVTLVGRDLASLFPGLKGAHLSSMSWEPALEAIRSIRSAGARIVINAMGLAKLHLVFCAQVHEGYLGFIWFTKSYDANLWISSGYNQVSADRGCTSEDVLGVANGLVIFQAGVWRPDRGSSLTCSSNMSVDNFRTEYFSSQGAAVGDHTRVPNNYTIMLEAAATADAVCMFALMLRDLFALNHSLADVAARKPKVYADAVQILGNSHFNGLQGEVTFVPDAADSSNSRMSVYQLQASRTPCNGARQCGDGREARTLLFAISEKGRFQILGGGSLSFHFEDEDYPLPATHSTVLRARPPDFDVCPFGELYNARTRQCEKCGEGRVFVSALGTCVCALGFTTSNSTCVPCAEGKYSANVDAAACVDCSNGTFAPTVGMSECSPCVVGTYAAAPGSRECTHCGTGREQAELWSTMRLLVDDQVGTSDRIDLMRHWSYAEGSTTPEMCGCNMGAREQDGECIPCGQGLSCTGMGDVYVEPGFYSDVEVSVYSCRGDIERCNGGVPGSSCNEGRLGISCSECEEGKAPGEGGKCQPCGTHHYGVIVLVCSAFMLVLTIAYFVIGRPATRSNEVVTLVAFFGLLLTAVQVFSVVGTFQLLWKDPLKTALNLVALVGSLNLEVLQVGCVQIPPIGRFALKVMIIFLACAWLAVVHFVTVCFSHRGEFRRRRHVLKCVLGTVLMTFYITVVSAVLTPLQCEDHPNSKRTVREYPGILCWESEEHPVMVGLGISAFMCIAVPHIVRCILVVRQFPARMRMADTLFLQENSFLFFRFRPEMYWYCLLIVLRSLCCASLLVIPNVIVQVALLQFVMNASLLIGLHCLPWRTKQANFMEIIMCLLMVGFCAFTGVLADATQGDLVALSYLCTLMVAGVIVPFPLYSLGLAGWKLLWSKKHFQFFLCHHKAGAGAFTRLLKLTLLESPSVTREVFVDSDNLENLATLFNIVGTHTETLVVVASHSVFRRPWCVGEMTVARLNGLKTLLVKMPDIDMPTPGFITSYGDQVMDLEALTAEGIGLDAIQETLQWTHELEKVELELPLDKKSVYDLTARLCGKATWFRSAGFPTKHEVYMVCDPGHLEAVAAAYVLQKLVVPFLLKGGLTTPEVLDRTETLPAYAKDLVVLLSGALIEQDSVLQALVSAARLQVRVLPVTLEEAFRFPSQAELEDLRRTKGTEVADVVMQTLKEVSVPFQPQHASLSTLELGAKQVAKRLSASQFVSLKPTRSYSGSFSLVSSAYSITKQVSQRVPSKEVTLVTPPKPAEVLADNSYKSTIL